MSAPPRISVGLPVRNGERFLGETLTSLLAQDHGDFELVISDNASTDGTQEICRAAARADRRVRYLRQEQDLGANSNYNAVALAARGELFRWAAHDDLVAPDYLRRTVELLDGDPRAVLAHAQTGLIDDDGRPLQPAGRTWLTLGGAAYDAPDPTGQDRELDAARPSVRFRDVLLRSLWCFEIYGLVRRDALLATGLQRGFYGTDKVVLAQLALQGTFRYVEEPLFSRRCHTATSTSLGLWSKVRWADPDARVPVPPVVRMVGGYASAPFRTPLPLRERAACLAAVAEKALQPDKVRNLVVPGPSNYWGVDRRGARP